MELHEIFIEEDDDSVLIVDSDTVDTLEELTKFTDILEDTIEPIEDNIVIEEDNNDDDFELLCLSSISSEIGIGNYFKTENSNNNLNEDINPVQDIDLLSPSDLVNALFELKNSALTTLQKLKSLQMQCEKAILDIEHSLEFEEFTVTEGYGQALLIKELRMKRRIIKDTLDKYDAIKPITDTLDKNFSNKFMKNQLKSLDKTEQIQSNRIYSPRILKNLDISKKPVNNNKINNLEEEIANILCRANSLVKANS